MEVLTLELVKSHLRLAGTAEDTFLTLLAEAAEDWAKRMLGIQLTEAARTEYCDGGGVSLWPPWGPIVEVDTVTDMNSGVAVVSTLWHLRNARHLIRDGDLRWPEGRRRYKVEYTAGYGTTLPVPSGLTLGLLDVAHRFYNNRAGVAQEGAAGWSGRYDKLVTSDVFAKLRPFSHKVVC